MQVFDQLRVLRAFHVAHVAPFLQQGNELRAGHPGPQVFHLFIEPVIDQMLFEGDDVGQPLRRGVGDRRPGRLVEREASCRHAEEQRQESRLR